SWRQSSHPKDGTIGTSSECAQHYRPFARTLARKWSLRRTSSLRRSCPKPSCASYPIRKWTSTAGRLQRLERADGRHSRGLGRSRSTESLQTRTQLCPPTVNG